VEISFKGPYSWHGAYSAPEALSRGIYAHTVPQQDHHLVYYAGQTGESFYNRMLQHEGHFRAGEYPIYPAASFAQGSQEGKLNRGMFDGGDSKEVRKANSVRLAKQIQEMLDVMQVFFAPFETDKRTRERIEGVIIDELYAIPNSFFWKGVRRARRRHNEVPFKCSITGPVKLLGMPLSVWA
jgi:hypothetical protein